MPMARLVSTYLLGWPITSEDILIQDILIQDMDSLLSLKQLAKFAETEDVSIMCLDVSVCVEDMGRRVEFELVPDGATKEVTNENLSEYLEATIRYRVLERFRPQLTELLLGVFDVVPEPALAVFKPFELERLFVGPTPDIDIPYWKANTE